MVLVVYFLDLNSLTARYAEDNTPDAAQVTQVPTLRHHPLPPAEKRAALAQIDRGGQRI